MKNGIYVIMALIAFQGSFLESMHLIKRLEANVKKTRTKQRTNRPFSTTIKKTTSNKPTKNYLQQTLLQAPIQQIYKHTKHPLHPVSFQQKRSYLTAELLNGIDSAYFWHLWKQRNKNTLKDPRYFENRDCSINFLTYCSPTIGAYLIETDFLKKLYEYGDPKLLTTQLVHKLFHKQGSEFYPTRSLSLPAASLDAKGIGILIKNVDKTGTFNFNGTEEQELIKKWNTAHKKLDGGNITKKIKDLIMLLQASIQECSIQNPHAPFSWHMPYAILLSFLWAKTTTKNEVDSYTYNLFDTHLDWDHSSLNELKRVIPYVKKWTTIDISDNLIVDHPRVSIPNCFDVKYSFNSTEDRTWRLKDLELLVMNLSIYNNLLEGFALPHQLRISYYTGTIFKQHCSTAMCAENGIRGICNLLLANSKTKQFDFTLLPPSTKPQQALLDFYKKFPLWEAANQDATNEWAELVAQRSFLFYAKENFELRSRKENFFNFLTYFFNIPATSWQELGDLLSTHERKITFENITNPQNERESIVILNITNEKEYIVTAKINFNYDFHTTYEQKEKFFNNGRETYVDPYYHPKTKEKILDLIQKNGPHTPTATAILPFFDCNKKESKSKWYDYILPKKYTQLFAKQDLSMHTLMHIWFSRDLTDQKILHDTILEALKVAPKNPHILGTIKQWISCYPQRAPADLIKNTIIEHNIGKQDEWFAQYAQIVAAT
ncbi:MAG TPA: hypothetical protein VEK38_03650 [Candidatus Bathyarchaeia archaeon]|nr:hypothetical protein [Candidatus Bathyarchaeia archaeon]